jgi:two-component system, OmpR family, response regulator
MIRGLGKTGAAILVIEDDSNFRELLEVFLALEDDVSEVRTAANGYDAIQECARFRPDVVLIDLMLPDGTARDVAIRIRGLHPRALLVTISGMDMDTSAWADHHVSKGPHTLEEIRRLVSQRNEIRLSAVRLDEKPPRAEPRNER